MEHWRNDEDMGKSESLAKNLFQFHLSTTNPTWNGLGPNLGFQVERLESERLSHGMAPTKCCLADI